MADAQMRYLIGWSWPWSRKRFLGFYWASRGRFTEPGLHVWAFGCHARVLPLPRKVVR